MRVEVKRGDTWLGVGAIFPYAYFDPFDELRRMDSAEEYEARKRQLTERTTEVYGEEREAEEKELKQLKWRAEYVGAKPWSPQPYTDRNYLVFAALAGVRNAWDLTPVAEPRGLPVDMAAHDLTLESYYSESERDELREYWRKQGLNDAEVIERERENMFGDHSFSHLTLRELLLYDWEQPLKDGGHVYLLDWLPVRDKEGMDRQPKMWAGGIGGGGVHYTTVEYAAGYDPETMDPEKYFGAPARKVVVQDATWTAPLRQQIGGTWFRLLDQLSRWGRDSWEQIGETSTGERITCRAPDHVRLVFGFDS